ncbi:MAG TPA: long-chain-fatty-acid--CoA ligase [Bacteroidetes bacterium]|nr:long-chain-fatty-acid--CoA ligase [Bacteroidota bacterium]
MTEQRPWLKNYPEGVPANINPDAFPTLVDLLDHTFKKYGNKPAFSCMGKELSFSQIDKMSQHFGAYLHSRGLEPGDKIALMMPNLLQYPIALFGCLRAGLLVVNTNPLYTPREMKHQFTDSGVKAILICDNFAANLQKIIADTEIKTIIVTSIGEMLGFAKGMMTNFVVRKIKGMVPKYNLPNTVTFKEALSQGKKFTVKEFSSGPQDVIMLQYTGGTTGVSKGAMLTNRNLVANMMQVQAAAKNVLVDGGEISLSPLPLYHIFAFSVNCLAFFSLGALNVLVTNPRDLPSVMKEFKNYKITNMTGVNTLFNALLNHPDFAKLDFSSLKFSIGGGMAVQKVVAEKWQQVTGTPLIEGYGMTESSPVATISPVDGSGKLGYIGMPAPSTDMRIVDEKLRPLPVGEIGEIQIKGPQVMKGYYNRPEATAKTIVDGWLCTGDIGLMDEDGYFKIVDRKKDMILVSGFNVFPNEIEEVLVKNPKVLEAAAVGVPHEKSGEVVKVYVVKKDPSLTEKEVIDHCRTELTGYKVPKLVEFRKDLPKSNVGKILRRKLRDEMT